MMKNKEFLGVVIQDKMPKILRGLSFAKETLSVTQTFVNFFGKVIPLSIECNTDT
jgi:hypothetical protein